MNMLSAEKVRLHGMRDKRWTTQDKITQYKGMVKLYLGDKKTQQSDLSNAVDAQVRENNSLLNMIKEKREELDSAIFGARNLIESVLVHHKTMRYAYRHLPSDKIIEALKQNNYLQRRKLDLLLYRRQNKEKILAELWLERGETEDLIKQDITDRIPVEKECAAVTDKVQNRTLQIEAAISVRNSYHTIVQLLWKDTIYYDQLLNTLKRDVLAQNRCMYQVTVLGQLAVEYLDDRKTEFKALEKMVKRTIKSRRDSLEEARQQLKRFPKILMNLIRKDDDIAQYQPVYEDQAEFDALAEELAFLEKSLKELKYSVKVPEFGDILPCLERQVQIQEKLTQFRDKGDESKQKLTKAVEHGKIRLDTLINTTNVGLQNYKTTKEVLLNDTAVYDENIKSIKENKLYISKILLRLRETLLGIESNCKIARRDEDARPSTVLVYEQSSYIDLQNTGIETIREILPVVERLVATASGMGLEVKDLDITGHTYITFTNYKQAMSSSVVKESKLVDYDFDDLDDVDMIIEDSSVPTNHDIKEESAKIVETAKALELIG